MLERVPVSAGQLPFPLRPLAIVIAVVVEEQSQPDQTNKKKSLVTRIAKWKRRESVHKHSHSLTHFTVHGREAAHFNLERVCLCAQLLTYVLFFQTVGWCLFCVDWSTLRKRLFVCSVSLVVRCSVPLEHRSVPRHFFPTNLLKLWVCRINYIEKLNKLEGNQINSSCNAAISNLMRIRCGTLLRKSCEIQ